MAALKAFRSDFMSSDLIFTDDFEAYESRRLRYSIYWAMYENTVFQDFHKWSVAMKAQHGLYRYIRNIYSPAYRLGEFWKTHLLGGALDLNAGDGKRTPSSLPIITASEDIRDGISSIWRNSNWQIKKDVLSLWGSVLGDVGIKIVDDTVKGKCYLKIIKPADIESLILDDFGNVKEYVLSEVRDDPEGGNKKVTYREIAYRNGDNVIYETELNGKLYDWDGDGLASWSVPYGFVPMVFIKHNDVGLDFGWSEMHANRSKFMEVDDLASKLSDHIRKEVDPPWLFSGVSKGASTPKTTSGGGTTESPQKGREEKPALYSSDPNASAQALVSNLNIADTSAHILSVLEKLEKEYPELNISLDEIKGDLSGRAIQINREPAKDRVIQRRPNYDDAIVRAHMMALSIGGYRNYEEFSGISLESFGNGDLDHMIGNRPVFSKTIYDELEEDTEFWKSAKTASEAGVPLPVFLEMKGWEQEEIEKITNSVEYKSKIAALKAMEEAASFSYPNE